MQEIDFYINKLKENINEKFNIDFDTNDLTNKCDYAQKILYDLMTNDGFILYPKETQKVINKNVLGHSFLVLNKNGKYFLIDPTFKQFCTKEKCTTDYFIIANDGTILRSPDPGFYLMYSKEGTDLLNELNTKGYIELTEQTSKLYCDSFYKGKTGKEPHSNISGKTYLNSLTKPEYTLSLTEERYNELYNVKRR